MIRRFIAMFLACVSLIQSEEFAVKVSENEGKAIVEIVTTLGTTNALSLVAKVSHLKSLGAGLKGIGPLHFLGYIFSDQELKPHMKVVQKSSTKWNGFMKNLRPGFERELKSNKLIEDLPAFAKLVGVDHQQLLSKVNEHNWDGFVGLLIEDKK